MTRLYKINIIIKTWNYKPNRNLFTEIIEQGSQKIVFTWIYIPFSSYFDCTLLPISEIQV